MVWIVGQHLVREGQPCDRVIVNDELKQDDRNINLAYLSQVAAQGGAPDQAERYAARVRDLHLRRRALLHIHDAEGIIRTSNGTWATDLAAALGRVGRRPSPCAGAR